MKLIIDIETTLSEEIVRAKVRHRLMRELNIKSIEVQNEAEKDKK